MKKSKSNAKHLRTVHETTIDAFRGHEPRDLPRDCELEVRSEFGGTVVQFKHTNAPNSARSLEYAYQQAIYDASVRDVVDPDARYRARIYNLHIRSGKDSYQRVVPICLVPSEDAIEMMASAHAKADDKRASAFELFSALAPALASLLLDTPRSGPPTKPAPVAPVAASRSKKTDRAASSKSSIKRAKRTTR